MKKICTAMAAVAAVVMWGCSKPGELSGGDDGLEKPEQATVFVEYTQKNGVASQEGGPGLSVDGSQIRDMNLYVFNAAGMPVYSRFSTAPFRIEDLSYFRNASYRVYALANWGREVQADSEARLRQLRYRPEDPASPEEGAAAVPMSGYLSHVVISDGMHLEVPLERILSKVEVQFDLEGLNPDVALSVEAVALRNVPCESSVFGENAAAEVAVGKKYTAVGNMNAGLFPFYLLENLQGEVPGAQTNKDKAELLGPDRRKVCSCVEVQCRLSSAVHSGTMKYLFYLGTGLSDCNVRRNTSQKVTVHFRGNASEDETSVSVDNSALLDRVTRVELNPGSYAFNSYVAGGFRFSASVFPATAYDRRLSWSSSDSTIARVDALGTVFPVSNGSCRIIAGSVENPAVSGSAQVKVQCPYILELPKTASLYAGEQRRIPFRNLFPQNRLPEVRVSDPSVLQVVEVGMQGIVVRALKEGRAQLRCIHGDLYAQCAVAVEPLRIEFPEQPIEFHVGFNRKVPCRVYPASAEGLELEFDLSAAENLLRQVAPGVMQGRRVSGTDFTLSVRFKAFPGKTYAAVCRVLPAVSFGRNSLDLLWKGEVTRANGLDHSADNMFLEYAPEVKTAPGAVYEVVSSNGKVVVSPSGRLSLSTGSVVNGRSVAVVSAKVRGDDGVDYTASLPVNAYEEANIWAVYEEFADGPNVEMDGMLQQPVTIRVTPICSSPLGNAPLDFSLYFDFNDLKMKKETFFEEPQYREDVETSEPVVFRETRSEDSSVKPSRLWYFVSVPPVR